MGREANTIHLCIEQYEVFGLTDLPNFGVFGAEAIHCDAPYHRT